MLEGPQGTLFGAGAEAGVIRYITNKPKLNVTEASVNGGYGFTADGDPNTECTAVLNLPLITDTLARPRRDLQRPPRRLYQQRAAHLHAQDTDLGIHYANYPAGCGSDVPALPGAAGSRPINNYGIASKAINPVDLSGHARLRRCGRSTMTGTR